ncbi:MAG: cobaltochelatase subunit CobN [Alphaproteobacteria bacterium]
MHFIVGDQKTINNGSGANIIKHTPADWIFLSFADSDLSLLALAIKHLGKKLPAMRAASLNHLTHPFAIDDYIEKTAQFATTIVIRLLGGKNYWLYGVEQFYKMAQQKNITIYFLHGDPQIHDTELLDYCHGDHRIQNLLENYWQKGGVDNIITSLELLQNGLTGHKKLPPPRDILPAGLYAKNQNYDFKNWLKEKPKVVIFFYRAYFQSGQMMVIDKIIESLRRDNITAVAIYISASKDNSVKKIIHHLFSHHQPKIILSLLNFSHHSHNNQKNAWQTDCPVLQPLLSSAGRKQWQNNPQGLSAQDATLSIILPEQDGNINHAIIGFKESLSHHKILETELKNFKPASETMPCLVATIKSYLTLQNMKNHNKRLAIMTSNYPTKDSRLLNGVGLDTPKSIAIFFKTLHKKNYDLGKKYKPTLSGDNIIQHLLAGITNHYPIDKKNHITKKIRLTLSLSDYKNYFSQLSPTIQKKIIAHWGSPTKDKFYHHGKKSFLIMGEKFGKILLLLQPQRGYDIDPDAMQHDPHLPPPHYYIAHYAYVEKFSPDSFIHFGKHGNLEWLSGKSLGSLGGKNSPCLPRAFLPSCPYFYPFIINDPGEGAQAKRRTSSAIIAHLPPMMMRAEQSTSLQKLEWLMDEYQQARQLNETRTATIIDSIWQELIHNDLDKELAIDKTTWSSDQNNHLATIDRHLCALRDLQIRGGLHIFGGKIDQQHLAENIFYIMRLKTHLPPSPPLPPLTDVIYDIIAIEKNSKTKHILENAFAKKILSDGDKLSAIEKLSIIWLELLLALPYDKKIAKKLQPLLFRLKKSTKIKPMEKQAKLLLKKILLSPKKEVENIMLGLDGKFVPPGGAGAPSRGQPDLLPTGHNFFTIDNRKTPSTAAFDLARRSGHLVLARYLSEHGDYPKTITLTAWGTAEIRTAGETIAMALWLMGVEPTWDMSSGRVLGFTILPLSLLARPRVMINLRISGFFRDAFPHLIDLFDEAHRAIANLPEPANDNPIAEHYKKTIAELHSQGIDKTTATHISGAAIFGPAPGSYGTGLQQMLDNGSWQESQQLAQQFLNWTSHYYGKRQTIGKVSIGHKNIFHDKLTMTDIVMQNQDNREHDILDSDDYYQFQGGLFNAAVFLQNKHGIEKKIAHYHNDHSNPAKPIIRSLHEEIGLILRGRAINEKWLKRIRQHGYKGGFEMAATVDYLFAFAATTAAVTPKHFDLLFQHYLLDKTSLEFLRQHNLPALYDMAKKFQEAIDRKLWQPRQNHIINFLQKLLVEKNLQID